MGHNNQAVLAVSKEPNPTRYQKTLGINDFYFGGPGSDFPLGNIQMVGKSQAPMFRGENTIAKLAPLFTLESWPARASTSGSAPRICPGPRTGSRWRATAASVSYTKTNRSRPEALRPAQVDAGEPGMHPEHLIPRNLYLKNEMDIAAVAHQAGTCRFGKDPATSVLDVELQGARAGQPLRRRHQLLPEHRRGEPGPDRDRERAPRRGSPPPAARLTRDGRQPGGVDGAPRARPGGEIGAVYGAGCCRASRW